MPTEILEKLRKKIKPQWKTAFISAVIFGLLIHLPVILSDIPNHDGLDSMYFDQNMITSGRWFLTVACGFSSYYTIPWVIGIIGIFFLACTSVALTELLEADNSIVSVLISGLLISFPALASTFAYVFTMDGYMLALFLAVMAVLAVKIRPYGFAAGAVCLAFSMGIYQAYLPFTIILSIYSALIIIIENGTVKTKLKSIIKYLYMGILGVVLYYVILQLLLKLEGKELASYQGISGLGSLASGAGILETVKNIYVDFLSFSVRGNVIFHSVYSIAALTVLCLAAIITVILMACSRKWWKNLLFFVIIAVLALLLPIATNIILIISPDVTYHLLMRYQWILYPILMLAFVYRYGIKNALSKKMKPVFAWSAAAACALMIFCYGITDNIGYSNLQKRYEKTYAYCIRLLDRIEQTEGYYQGIPVAIVGVVGYVPYPETDITGDVTSGMIGLSGDYLLYTGSNYETFIKNYLGASLNFLEPEEMSDIYYSDEYIEMESFPGETSVKIIDGVLCVKTENTGRD
jgi:hypothetical protein